MDKRITIKQGALRELGKLVSSVSPFKTVVITDNTVEGLWLDDVLEQIDAETIIFNEGEEYKNLETVSKIWDDLLEINFSRESLILALGGGVVSDISGFVASTFMRGTKYGIIPTTLLSQIDASIGGKTGFNFKGKNMIGTFKKPDFILIDPDTLKTLPFEEMRNGFGELVKYGVLNKDIFNVLFELNNVDINIDLIEKCVEYKKKIVREDLMERNTRRLLNLGHTVGHSIERLSDYDINHGNAISVGLYVNSLIGEQLFNFDANITKKMLSKYGLPHTHNFSPEKILSNMKNDKKNWYNEAIMVIPKDVNEMEIMNVEEDLVIETLSKTRES